MTAEEESVQVDAYLNTLLAGRFTRPRSLGAADQVDFELEATAGVVQRALARFHPSFAFEEQLASRLAAIGAGRADPGRVERAAPVVLPIPVARREIRRFGGERQARSGLLRGAAISPGVSIAGVSIAGVSIAGAALLVRRRTRPGAGAHHPAEAGV